jgi:hypothetical protein
VGEVGVTDIDGLGGGNVGVDGYGREGGSEETSITPVYLEVARMTSLVVRHEEAAVSIGASW